MVSIHLTAGEAFVCSLRFRLPCILPVCFVAFFLLIIYFVFIYQKKKKKKFNSFLISYKLATLLTMS